MAEKVIAFQFSKRFKKKYNNLLQEIQKAFDEKLSLFLQQMSHPSLRVKRVQGTKNQWEESVAMKYRFTFQFSENTLIFRAIGTHDIISRDSQ